MTKTKRERAAAMILSAILGSICRPRTWATEMVAVSAAMAWLPVAVAVGQTRMFPADEWETRRPEDQQVYWYMSGNGGQFNMVLPAEGIVFTRVNNYANTPRVLIEDFEPLIFDLVIP